MPLLQQISGNLILLNNPALATVDLGNAVQTSAESYVTVVSPGTPYAFFLRANTLGLTSLTMTGVSSLRLFVPTIRGLVLSSLNALTTASFTTQFVFGDLTLATNLNIGRAWSFPSLQTVFGALTIRGNVYHTSTDLAVLYFPVLTTVTGDLRIDNNRRFADVMFSSLLRIGGALRVENNEDMASVQIPALQSVCEERGSTLALVGIRSLMLCPNSLVTNYCGSFPRGVPTQAPAGGCP